MEFNVIVYDFNNKKFIPYNVIPTILDDLNGYKLFTLEELKDEIESIVRYRFWAKCEWEIILGDWPSGNVSKKIDVYEQIMNNFDIVVNIIYNQLVNKDGKSDRTR